MDNNLDFWSAWLPGFQAVMGVLARRDLLELFEKRCLEKSRYAHLAWMFRTEAPKVPKWRWGLVKQAVSYLLRRKVPLSSCFDAREFSDAVGREQEGKEDAPKPLLVQETLRSKLWWAWCMTIQQLHGLTSGLLAWAEQCPCHGWLQNLEEGTSQEESPEAEQLKILHRAFGKGPYYDGKDFMCPMRGKRALEVSLGVVAKVTNNIANHRFAALLVGCPDLQEDDVARICNSFEGAKAFVQMELTLRLSFWQKLPWSLVRLSDWDTCRARQHAKGMIAEFDASRQEEILHHPLTWEWLRPGSTLRTQLAQFADGTDLLELQPLAGRVMELLFVPLIERAQEGQHSVVHRASAFRHVSGPYVSFSLRAPEMIELVKYRGAARDHLICMFEHFMKPKRLAQHFGILRHPLWIQLKKLQVAGGRPNFGRAAALILFSTDPADRFWRNEKAKAAQAAKRRLREARVRAVKASFAKLNRVPLQLKVECVAARDHLRLQLFNDQLYSMPAQSSLFHDLTDRMSTPQRRPTSSASSKRCLESDVSTASNAGGKPMDDRVFFKMLRTRPAAGKHLKASAALGMWLESNDIAVTFHEAVHGGGRVSANSQPMLPSGQSHSVSILQVSPGCIAELRAELKSQTVADMLQYSIPGEVDPSGSIVQLFVRSKAWPGTSGMLSIHNNEQDILDIARGMAGRGLARCFSEDSNFSKWQLTERGVALLIVSWRTASEPERVLALPDHFEDMLALNDAEACTAWHFIEYLRLQGWKCKALPKVEERCTLAPLQALEDNRDDGEPPGSVEYGPKVWYSTGQSVDTLYVRTLASHVKLFSAGAKMVRHWQSEQYYQALLSGEIDGHVPLPIKDRDAPAAPAAPRALRDIEEDAMRDVDVASDEENVSTVLPSVVPNTTPHHSSITR